MYVNSLGNLLEVLKIFMQNLRDFSLVIVPLHAFDAKTFRVSINFLLLPSN